MTRQATAGPAPGFASKPDYKMELRPAGLRVCGETGGLAVVESDDALVLLEASLAPVWYFPRADIRMDLLARTETSTFCPYKGDAAYWTLSVPAGARVDAGWSYERPFDEAMSIAGRIAFYWDALDRWFENGVPCADAPSRPAG